MSSVYSCVYVRVNMQTKYLDNYRTIKTVDLERIVTPYHKHSGSQPVNVTCKYCLGQINPVFMSMLVRLAGGSMRCCLSYT